MKNILYFNILVNFLYLVINIFLETGLLFSFLINSTDNIILENFYADDLKNVSFKEHLWEWDSNYIYETEN